MPRQGAPVEIRRAGDRRRGTPFDRFACAEGALQFGGWLLSNPRGHACTTLPTRARYVRHRPADTVLYRVVEEHRLLGDDALKKPPASDTAILDSVVADQPDVDEMIGKQLGGCEIVALIGRGGMGAVYRARQVDMDRTVAVKTIRPDIGGDELFVERFQQEARNIAKFNTPHVTQAYSAGFERGILEHLVGFYGARRTGQQQRRQQQEEQGPKRRHFANRLISGRIFSSKSCDWIGPTWR